MATTPSVKSEYYLDPVTGQRYVMSKPGGTTDSSGNPAGNMVGEIRQASGELGAITFTCNAATDAITDITAPASGEICWANTLPAGTKMVRFKFHNQNGTGIPHALGALVSVNATDEATYISRFTTPDNGPQAAARTTFNDRQTISNNSPEASFSTLGTSTDIVDIGIGFILPTGTGADSVLVTAEFLSGFTS